MATETAFATVLDELPDGRHWIQGAANPRGFRWAGRGSFFAPDHGQALVRVADAGSRKGL